MKRYAYIVVAVAVVMLLIFWIFEATGLSDLQDPDLFADGGRLMVAAFGSFLLAADVVLPIPSSVIMLGHGALFGVALGTVVSLVGSLAGVAVAFVIGRRGGRLLEAVTAPEEMETADHLFRKWGTTAVILSRPLPIVAETVVLFAGASSMTWRRVLVASTVGLIPTCLAYAAAGAIAMSFDNLVLIFAVTCGIAAIGWFVDRRVRRRSHAREQHTTKPRYDRSGTS